MALNGGPMYKMTPAFSFSVYCENEKETRKLYNLLSENGNILIPLDKYDWSPLYAWIEDKYGVSWQLDANSSGQNEKIIPTLLLVNQKNTLVKEAVEYYKNIFPSSDTIFEAPFSPDAGMPEGSLLFARFQLNGNIFNAMSSPGNHDYDFTPGNSMVIECDTQEEIDYFWEKLGKEGHYSMCGWLEDKYGVSWQIIPSVLPDLMTDSEKVEKVTQTFMKMQKLEIAALLDSIR
jgi:predicted 3-demethylubiquinone-9 3-methyltransferase (glyoxalase superfamily)